MRIFGLLRHFVWISVVTVGLFSTAGCRDCSLDADGRRLCALFEQLLAGPPGERYGDDAFARMQGAVCSPRLGKAISQALSASPRAQRDTIQNVLAAGTSGGFSCPAMATYYEALIALDPPRRPRPPGTLSRGPLSIAGGLRAPQVERVVDQRLGELAYCFERTRKDQRPRPARATVALRIQAGRARLDDAAIRGLSGPLQACVGDAVSGWFFSQDSPGPTTVRFDVDFEAVPKRSRLARPAAVMRAAEPAFSAAGVHFARAVGRGVDDAGWLKDALVTIAPALRGCLDKARPRRGAPKHSARLGATLILRSKAKSPGAPLDVKISGARVGKQTKACLLRVTSRMAAPWGKGPVQIAQPFWVDAG